MLKSYRARLIAFLAMIGVLIIALLTASYYSARWVIWEDAALAQRRTVEFHERSLEKLRIDLIHFANLLREDGQVQEYTFATSRIGAGPGTLEQLLEERFSSHSMDAVGVLWESGLILTGRDANRLRKEIQDLPKALTNTVFYLEAGQRIYLVTTLPIRYQGADVGRIVIARNLDKSWLESQPLDSQSCLFFERKGTVITSTWPDLVGTKLQRPLKRLQIQDRELVLAEIRLPGTGPPGIHLWLAQSYNVPIEALKRYNRIMLGLTVLSLSIILGVGLFAVNNFNQPIRRLINLTQEVAEGRLPALKRAKGDTEVDQLMNHFIDLIEALRTKQREVEEAHGKLRLSAITDELTGLYNRRYLGELYPKLLAQAEREGLCISAVLMDIDHFKRINDTEGHQVGDACLRHFSNILRNNCRTSDFIFRMGGEEFLILNVAQCGSNVLALAEKIRIATETTPLHLDGRTIQLTVSGGVSCMQHNHQHQPTLSRLISLADHALYAAKQSGRNRICESASCSKERCNPQADCNQACPPDPREKSVGKTLVN